MSVSIASKSINTPSGDGTSLGVTAPTGIETGDLLVAYCNIQSGTPTLAGWTRDSTASTGRSHFLYKIAVLADESAVDYTFTFSNGSRGIALFRITGADSSQPDTSNSGSGTSATATITTVTPNPNSLFLFGISTGDSVTHSNYAMATSNPIWIEEYDQGQSNVKVAVASALRPEITATGNITATISSSTAYSAGIFAVRVIPDITVSPSVVDLTASIQAPTVTGDANTSPAVISLTSSVQAPDLTQKNVVLNPNKNSSNWLNPDKS